MFLKILTRFFIFTSIKWVPPSIKKLHLAVGVFMYSAKWPFLKMVDILARRVLQFVILTSIWQRRVSCMRQGMFTLFGAPSTTSHLG